jgi:hypothetical protein
MSVLTHAHTQNAAFFTPKGAGAGRQISENHSQRIERFLTILYNQSSQLHDLPEKFLFNRGVTPMSMTSRQRILAAINHQEPDRVPIILGTSNTTGLKGNAYRNLKKYLGIEAEDRYIYDWPELGTAQPDEQTMQRLHSDARGVLDLYPAWVYEKKPKPSTAPPVYRRLGNRPKGD